MSRRVSVVIPGLIGDYFEKRMQQLGLTPSQFIHIMILRDVIRPVSLEEAGMLSIGVGRMKSGANATQIVAGLAPLFEKEGYIPANIPREKEEKKKEIPIAEEDVKRVVSTLLNKPLDKTIESQSEKTEPEEKHAPKPATNEPKMGNMTGYI